MGSLTVSACSCYFFKDMDTRQSPASLAQLSSSCGMQAKWSQGKVYSISSRFGTPRVGGVDCWRPWPRVPKISSYAHHFSIGANCSAGRIEKTLEDLLRQLRPPVPSVLAALRRGSFCSQGSEQQAKTSASLRCPTNITVAREIQCKRQWLRLRHCSKQFIILRLKVKQ